MLDVQMCGYANVQIVIYYFDFTDVYDYTDYYFFDRLANNVIASDSVATLGKQSRFAGPPSLPRVASSYLLAMTFGFRLLPLSFNLRMKPHLLQIFPKCRV
jgi:hypothetical protein